VLRYIQASTICCGGWSLQEMFKDLTPGLKHDVHLAICGRFLQSLRCLGVAPLWLQRFLAPCVKGEFRDQVDDERTATRVAVSAAPLNMLIALQAATPQPAYRPRDLPALKSLQISFVCLMGVWQRVAMDSLKFHLALPCPTLLRPAGGPPLKQPYGRVRGGPPTGGSACGYLLPLWNWTPHAVLLRVS
jgi:hypothetical protein